MPKIWLTLINTVAYDTALEAFRNNTTDGSFAPRAAELTWNTIATASHQ